MKSINTIIAEIHSDVNEELDSLVVNNRSFNIVGKTKKGEELLELVRSNAPELVLLSKDIVDRNKSGMELCRLITGEFPSTTVIITSPLEEPNDLRNSMKVGARDFIALNDFEDRLVDSAIELVSNTRKYDFTSTDRHGKVISFISPKGGLGKTTLALNMAAELKKRIDASGSDKKVLVLDYDLQFGDVSYMSNLKPQRTLADLNDMKSLDTDALEAHLTEHPKGFWVLAAPKKPQYADIIRPEILEQAITIARRSFDYIIIDSIQGFHSSTLVSIDQSDIIGIMTSAELVSLKNAKLTIEMLEELMDQDLPQEKIRLIVNKVDRLSVPIEEIPKKFGYKVLGSMPKDDKTLAQATNRSEFVVLNFSNSEVAKSIKNIVTELDNEFYPTETKGSKKEVQENKGLLGKIFGK